MTSTYIALATIQLTSTDGDITFSSIPATYRDLVLVISGSVTASEQSSVTFNGSTAAEYSEVVMLGFSGGPLSYTTSGNSFTQVINGTTNGMTALQIMDYAQTNKHKTVLNRGSGNGASTIAVAGRWANTNAIHTLRLFVQSSASYTIGSTISLYGIN